MTREEQIIKAAEDWASRGYYRVAPHFVIGATWADANRWVKVEDGSPEFGVLYDIIVDGQPGIGMHNGKKWFGKTWDWDFIRPDQSVTHFSLRLEPPKAEQ